MPTSRGDNDLVVVVGVYQFFDESNCSVAEWKITR